MRIAHVAAELAPWCSTGGLGAVLAALPAAIAARGPEVDVYVPMCRGARDAVAAGELAVTGSDLAEDMALRVATAGPVRIVFVDAPRYFDRDSLYGRHGAPYHDDAERFAAFTRGVVAAWDRLDLIPDVAHAHDWHAALLPAYVPDGRPTVLTIHNIAHQGDFPETTGASLDLPGPTTGEGVNFLAVGAAAADVVTTVSPRHAAEILTPEMGYGLNGVLRGRHPPPAGIRNGIDVAEWNPATDPHLPAAFTADDQAGKATARAALLAEVEMADRGGLLAVVVARLTWQKGTDLVAGLGPALAEVDAQLVVVGQGDPSHEKALASMAAQHPERVAFVNEWSPRLAHLAVAGADVMVIPSRFEPCGLTQMEAMRYGTLPVATATGGLVDTISDVDDAGGGEPTGFLFPAPTAAALAAALRRAAALRASDPDGWQRVRYNAMRRDWTWADPAARYVAIYEKLVSAPG